MLVGAEGGTDHRASDRCPVGSTYQPISVLVVDDDYYAREATRSLLSRDRRTRVWGCSASTDETRRLLESTPAARHPHVVLHDIHLGEQATGIDAIPEIKELCPKTKVLVMSMDRGEDVIPASGEGRRRRLRLEERVGRRPRDSGCRDPWWTLRRDPFDRRADPQLCGGFPRIRNGDTARATPLSGDDLVPLGDDASVLHLRTVVCQADRRGAAGLGEHRLLNGIKTAYDILDARTQEVGFFPAVRGTHRLPCLRTDGVTSGAS